MKASEIEIGKRYLSKVNGMVKDGYEVIKKYKTVCWVNIDGTIYKGVPYRILKPM